MSPAVNGAGPIWENGSARCWHLTERSAPSLGAAIYTGYCMVCGCRLWEHFGGSMVYPDGTSLMFYRDYPGDSGEIFFLPQTGQLSLFSLFNATLNIAEGLLHA
jgi:hypothetical protein